MGPAATTGVDLWPLEVHGGFAVFVVPPLRRGERKAVNTAIQVGSDPNHHIELPCFDTDSTVMSMSPLLLVLALFLTTLSEAPPSAAAACIDCGSSIDGIIPAPDCRCEARECENENLRTSKEVGGSGLFGLSHRSCKTINREFEQDKTVGKEFAWNFTTCDPGLAPEEV